MVTTGATFVSLPELSKFTQAQSYAISVHSLTASAPHYTLGLYSGRGAKSASPSLSTHLHGLPRQHFVTFRNVQGQRPFEFSDLSAATTGWYQHSCRSLRDGQAKISISPRNSRISRMPRGHISRPSGILKLIFLTNVKQSLRCYREGCSLAVSPSDDNMMPCERGTSLRSQYVGIDCSGPRAVPFWNLQNVISKIV